MAKEEIYIPVSGGDGTHIHGQGGVSWQDTRIVRTQDRLDSERYFGASQPKPEPLKDPETERLKLEWAAKAAREKLERLQQEKQDLIAGVLVIARDGTKLRKIGSRYELY